MNTERKMGDFWDAIQPFCKGTEVEFWLDDWKALGNETAFDEWRAFDATELQVRYFLEDITSAFAERMAGICTDELYEHVLREGRKVMTKIADEADKCGDHFGDAARVPVTASDAILMLKK